MKTLVSHQQCTQVIPGLNYSSELFVSRGDIEVHTINIASTVLIKFTLLVNHNPVITHFTSSAAPSATIQFSLRLDAGDQLSYIMTNQDKCIADAYIHVLYDDDYQTYSRHFDAQLEEILVK